MNDFTKLTEAELEARRQAVSECLAIGCVGFQRAIVEINRRREAESLLPFGSGRKPKPSAPDLSDRIDAINADIMTQPNSANLAELDGFNLPGILSRTTA